MDEAKKTLTAELIIQRTKTNKFDKIKNLNLWGNELEDVSIIKELPNVEVMSLSVNKITSLRDFVHCKKLTELYLRKNLISDLSEVQYLTGLENLHVLWLLENPCAEHAQYRQYVIKVLPNLVRLDNTVITSEEREAAQSIAIDLDNAPPAKVFDNPASKPKVVPLKARGLPPTAVQEEDKKREIPRKKPTADENERPIAKKNEPEFGDMDVDGAAPEPVNSISRLESVLCGILSLLKELDLGSLEIVKRDVERKLNSKKGSGS